MAAPPALLPLPSLLPHFDNTLGVIVIAELFTAVLFGVTSVQMYMYFHRNPEDSVHMKRTIYVLWLLDVLHLVLTTCSIYDYTVTNYANPLSLLNCPWSFAVEVPTGELGNVVVTILFAYRIQKLSGKMWPLLFILPQTLVSFGGSIAIGILAFKHPAYADFQARYAWIWHMTFGVQAFADCAIAASLCTLLIRRRTGFKRTDHLIRDLIVYSISTCLLTSSVSIASIVTYALMPHNFVFIGIVIVLPKLMLNALLALLNSRDALRDKNASQPVSIQLSRLVNGQSSTSDGAHTVRALGQAHKDQLAKALRTSSVVYDHESEPQAYHSQGLEAQVQIQSKTADRIY